MIFRSNRSLYGESRRAKLEARGSASNNTQRASATARADADRRNRTVRPHHPLYGGSFAYRRSLTLRPAIPILTLRASYVFARPPIQRLKRQCGSEAGGESAAKTGAFISDAGAISRFPKQEVETAPRGGPIAEPMPRRPSAESDGRA